MMGGIFAGGAYVPKCDKVTLYAYSLNKSTWYYPDRVFLINFTGKPDTGIMKHAAPVIIAFWSEG